VKRRFVRQNRELAKYALMLPMYFESLILTSCLSGTTRPNVCVSVLSSAKSHACSLRTSTFVKTLFTSKPNCPDLALTSTILFSSRSRINCRPNYSNLAPSFLNSVACKTSTQLLRKTNSPTLPHGVPKSLLPSCLVKPRGWMVSLKKHPLQAVLCSMSRHNSPTPTSS
jgi:hypothetical protein